MSRWERSARGYGLRVRLLGHSSTEIDEVISNDAEPDPTLHSGLAFVSAAVKAVSALSER
jgi:hypothetical protein